MVASMSRVLTLALVVALAACGDDGSNAMRDAGPVDTAVADAAFSGCDYDEQSDLTNDDVDNGTPEATGLTFTSSTVVCGVFDHTHFDGSFIVDVDAYTVALAADGDVLVRVHSKGMAALELIGIDVRNAAGTLVGIVTLYGDHGVTSMRLPAGTYSFSVFALASASVTTSTAYKVAITADVPDTRCVEVTTGGYMTETRDGAQNNGNDMITIPPGSTTPALTSSTTDMPEPANFVIAANFSIRAAGQAANINSPDAYEDKDAFVFATALGTNELTVRLSWPTAGANLDWMIFEQNNPDPIVRATTTTTTGLEMKITSVKPSTTYWLWIAAKVGAVVPATYNATLCGATFAPPM